MYEKQNGKCSYCGIIPINEYLTIDHKLPRSKGGTNSISNLQVACRDCNFLKLNKTDEEFILFLKTYIKNVARQLELKASLKN